MEVKNHVILLLDILGYKNLILNASLNKTENDYLLEIHQLLSSLADFIDKRNRLMDKSDKWNLNLSRFKSTIFSDNILFFAPYDSENDKINLYMNLIYGLTLFLFQYHKDDIFFRGAITAGPLYYDDNLHFIFGSGLVQAYELESNEAIYPRILIDDSLKPSPILVGVAQDTDAKWYVDYLTLAYSILCDEINDERAMTEAQAKAIIQNHKEAIVNALKKHEKNEKVLKKYRWLANYHNQFCQWAGLQNILIEES